MNFKSGRALFVRLLAKQDLLEIAERCRRRIGFEVLAETLQVFVDQVRVVVDDEYPIDEVVIEIAHRLVLPTIAATS